MFDKLINAFTAVTDTIAGESGKHPSDYCDLETVDSRHVLVSKNGSLVSLIEIHGIKRLIGYENYYQNVIEALTTSMSSMFSEKAHQMQVFFEVDPDRTAAELDAIQQPSVETCKRLGIDLEDLFAARTATLKEWVASERCYVALWTNPEALSKFEQSEEKKLRAERLRGQITSVHGQNPLAATVMIRNRHDSFRQAVLSELSSIGVNTSGLTAVDALRLIRGSIDPAFASKDWSPSMPGDRCYPSQRTTRAGYEAWDILWPTLGSQVCTRDAEIQANNMVEVGDRIYAPIYIDLFPQKPEFFSMLFSRAMEKNIPWRISFLMEGSGLDGFGFKAAVSSLLGFTNANTALINSTYKDLVNFKNQSGASIVQARIALCTWAPKGRKDLLAARASDLARCVERWGGAQVSETTGNPLAGLASTMPAFSKGSIATKTAAPMDEFLAMMPWSRPSSPWASGAVTLRTPDGKIMPYQPYSPLQPAWINLIFAKPGSGKSVLMSVFNLAMVTAAGQTRLPRIAILDIGPSSSGLISLLREAMRPEDRHLVVHRRLRMVESDAINPFDTQLGCRFPAPLELTFLRNLMTMLVTDPSDEEPDKGMPAMAAAVIDEMFLARSDRADPIRYAPGMNELVDKALKDYNIAIDQRSTWWEVTDALFEVDAIRAAAVAQRYAVPLLQDAVGIAQSEKIRTVYGSMVVGETGEPLIDSFCRMIGNALAMYPIMARPTAFDVGDARVTALDLDEVAKTGSVLADRQTAVMYMLARQVLAKDFYLHADIVADMPAPPHIELRPSVPAQKYKAYHHARIKEILEDWKRICYDEFHRTSKSKQVREQVMVDIREGRKWRVDITLASQDLPDFDEAMIKQATGVFIMNGGNKTTADEIANRFGFSDPAERHALERQVHAPRRGGGTFMAKFDTNNGWYTMLLSATMGPKELWAFSTSAEDVAVRTRLYEKLGPARARDVLAAVYPSGSAGADITDRKQRMSDDMKTSGASARSVVEAVVDDLIDYDRTHPRA